MWLDKFIICFLIAVNYLQPRVNCVKHKPIDMGDDRFDVILKSDNVGSVQEPKQQSILNMAKHTTNQVKEVSGIKADISDSIKAGKTPGISESLSNFIKNRNDQTTGPNLGSSTGQENEADLFGTDELDSNVIHSFAQRFLNRENVESSDFKEKFMINENSDDYEKFNIYRDQLEIKSIDEVTTFKFNHSNYVEQWKTLSLDEGTVLIGRTVNQLLLFVEDADGYKMKQSIDIKSSLIVNSDLEAFDMLDVFAGDRKDIVIISINEDLIWYEMKNGSLVEIWQWNLLRTILKVNHFVFEHDHVLLVSTMDSKNQSTVEFYEFDIETKQFWVYQIIPLADPVTSVLVLDTKKDLLVALTQQSKVSIFKYQYNKHERGKFVHFEDIIAPGVEVISGFRIGGYSYLAIGGENPQIMRYFEGKFHSQTILSQSFGIVEEFLPIPIQIYRDDLILLVQHRLQFPTHNISVLDALIWNGIAFDTALAVPCKIHDQHGFTCMLDLEREAGMKGATFVKKSAKKDALSVLVPRYNAHSGLYQINYEIVDVENPSEAEINELEKSYQLIRRMLEYEDQVHNELNEIIGVIVDPSADHRFNELKNVNHLITDFLKIEENVFLEGMALEFQDSNWTKNDFQLSMEHVEKSIESAEVKVEKMLSELSNLIRRNREAPKSDDWPTGSHYVGMYTFGGQLNASTVRVLPNENKREKRQRGFAFPQEVNLTNINVIDLIFETFNGIPVEELLFSENGIVNLMGQEVTFEDSLKVQDVELINNGLVNDINVQKEILSFDSQELPDSLNFESVQVESLAAAEINGVPVSLDILDDNSANNLMVFPNITTIEVFLKGNINVNSINGLDWQEFKNSLVPKHISSMVEEIEVDGEIVISGDASQLSINRLNELEFSNQYVLKKGPTETVITGKKEFKGSLVTTAIDTSGTVDNVNTFNVITLDQQQEIPTTTMFNSLEVTERLEVSGSISGRNLDDFMGNPTLLETREVNSVCQFKELIVEGPIIIENGLNGADFAKTLGNVVYDGENATIDSVKIFNNVDFSNEFNITSNMLNDLNLDGFVMANEDQLLNLASLQGDILFSNLDIGGLFDGVNETLLEMSAVRNFGDQYTDASLIFMSPEETLFANNIHVKNILNSVPVDDYLTADNMVINGDPIFQFLEVENLTLNGNVIGPGKLRNIDVDAIEKIRLSRSMKQNITAPYNISTLVSEGKFSADLINDKNMTTFKSYVNNVKQLQEGLVVGKNVQDFFVHGNVIVHSLNEKNIQEILENVIWLDRPNNISTLLNFVDDLIVEKKLTVSGFVNNLNFERFTSDLVLKSDIWVGVSGQKTFQNMSFVENVNASFINGIPANQIMKVEDEVDVDFFDAKSGMIQVNKLTISDSFNGLSTKLLQDAYKYDPLSNTHIITEDVVFTDPQEINFLKTPKLNQLNLDEFFGNLIRTDESNIVITSPKQFNGSAGFAKGIRTPQLNDMDLEFLNMILTTENLQKLLIIQSDIIFESKVLMPGLLAITGNLTSRFIDGIDPAEWRSNGVMIDEDFIVNADFQAFAHLFRPSQIIVNKLNNHWMRNLMLLNRDQIFENNLSVDNLEILNTLEVSGNFNNFNLEFEKNNTVMMFDEEQFVFAATSFQSAEVIQSLITTSRINSKDLRNAVPLKGDVLIESPLSFEILEAQNLLTEDTINNIKFNELVTSAVMSRGRDNQVIVGDWTVRKAVFRNNVSGNGLINNQDYIQVQRKLEENMDSVRSAVDFFSIDSVKLCNDMQFLANQSLNNVHVIKYFERSFKIKEPDEISSTFQFKLGDDNLLITNLFMKCVSNLYKWVPSMQQFKLISEVQTGCVANWLIVRSRASHLFLVTNGFGNMTSENVQGSGINIWRVMDNHLTFVRKIDVTENILELHEFAPEFENFLILTSSNKVIRYDIDGRKIEEWSLPFEAGTYTFAPYEFQLGLALYNGKLLTVLNSLVGPVRNLAKRSLESNVINLKLFNKDPIIVNDSFSEESPITRIKSATPVKENEETDSNKNKLSQPMNVPTIPATPLKQEDTKDDSVLGHPNIFGAWTLKTEPPTTTTEVISSKELISNIVDFYNKSVHLIDEINGKKNQENVDLPTEIPELEATHSENLGTTTTIIPSTTKIAKPVIIHDEIDTTTKTPKQNKISDNSNLDHNPDIQIFDEFTTIASNDEKAADENYIGIPLTPRITFNSEEEIFKSGTTSAPTSENMDQWFDGSGDGDHLAEERVPDDRVIARVIPGSGIRVANNPFLPEKGAGEAIVLRVGPVLPKRLLYAVSRNVQMRIPENQYMIQIYEDISEGKLYQALPCSQPSNLNAIETRDETFLVFLEGHFRIQIFIYRGISGFVPYSNFRLPDFASQLNVVSLQPTLKFKCNVNYIQITAGNELLFVEALISGNCGVTSDFNCDN